VGVHIHSTVVRSLQIKDEYYVFTLNLDDYTRALKSKQSVHFIDDPVVDEPARMNEMYNEDRSRNDVGEVLHVMMQLACTLQAALGIRWESAGIYRKEDVML
jgi:hypothetical protein